MKKILLLIFIVSTTILVLSSFYYYNQGENLRLDVIQNVKNIAKEESVNAFRDTLISAKGDTTIIYIERRNKFHH